MGKHDEMYKKIEQHGNKLNAIFNTGIDPVKLCKKLLRAENKARLNAERLCNIADYQEQAEIEFFQVEKHVDKILQYKQKNIPVFINRDPRGYALKIDDSYMYEHRVDLYRDFGGYGIIAPDFREE